jgi:NAD+ synthase (glutamine-hydrolysing)
MRNRVHLGAVALNTTPKDWDRNTSLIIESIRSARDAGVGILCLPELAITGYGCEDEFHAPYVSEWAMEILVEQILPEAKGIAVTIGLPIQLRGATYNAIALLVDGEIQGFVAKQNLAGDGIHYEPRFFKAWPQGLVEEIDVAGQSYPIGDLIFDLNGIRVGLEICEDAWVAQRPGGRLAQRAVDVILNPSASHFSMGKSLIRERFVQEGSRAFQCAYVYANLLGNEAGRAIYDGDCLIATGGQIIRRTEQCLLREIVLIHGVVDVASNRVSRNRQASFKTVAADASVVATAWCPRTDSIASVASLPTIASERFQQFEDATALGLYDYMRKSFTTGFTISLSGGADSSACLALVYIMAKKIAALPTLPAHIQKLIGSEATTVEALMERICNCAYQGTGNSSTDTLNAARCLAEQTGARFTNINVQGLVDQYEGILSDFLGRELTWSGDDISRQNIQARCRAPGIWAIANASNHLLLSTSNRSEAAVGYCTMDGDTAGSLSPLAGIDKEFLRAWLRWAEEKHLSELTHVNQLVPTAELRPEAEMQTDEDDLMPYSVLNRIQKLAVIEKKSPQEIFEYIAAESPAETPERVFLWLERYFKLWSRNQWKRERYAPSFHLDDENLDPRSWCRYPILSGGYIKELERLRQQLNINQK